jgi:hypothetical protein
MTEIQTCEQIIGLIEVLFGFFKTGERLVDFNKLRIMGMFTIRLIVGLRRFGEVLVGSSDFEFGLKVDFAGGGFGFVEGLGGAGQVGHVGVNYFYCDIKLCWARIMNFY